MFLVRGVMGDFMKLLPIVVSFSLIAAMLIDHFLLPVLSMYLMRVPKKRREQVRREQVRREQQEIQGNMTAQQIEAAAAEVIVAASRPKQIYGHMLRYALHHRLLVLVLSVVKTPRGAMPDE